MADPPTDSLPLNRALLLGRAIGRSLVDVERHLAVDPEQFSKRGGRPDDWFAVASGPTQLMFGPELVHPLAVWPSALSIVVYGEPLLDDPYAPRYRLSATKAPAWLWACAGQTVTDVRVHMYRDEAPALEPCQAAVSYCLSSGVEVFYCIYLHGRMDSDELMPGDAVPRDRIARSVSVRDFA